MKIWIVLAALMSLLSAPAFAGVIPEIPETITLELDPGLVGTVLSIPVGDYLVTVSLDAGDPLMPPMETLEAFMSFGPVGHSDGFTLVPEPGSWALMGFGLLGLAVMGRCR